MGATYMPRWGHYRKASETREKDGWVEDFGRLLNQAAPLPKPPAPAPAPEPTPMRDPAELFRELREKLGSL